MLAILSSIGMWLLKQFLSGILGNIEMHVQDQQQQQTDAALLKAQTVEEGAAVEVNSVKLNQTVAGQYAQEASNRPSTDPFGVNAWNEKK
ncbi:MAG: hypothetical protein GZ088_09730 [Acidipila sp.]|nr:hypothetical protein [Acidipila sp.]